MKRLESFAAAIFGICFLILGVAVTIETVTRKLFNISLQGVDELGGYLLAVGAALAMATALVSRAHIRIDLLHGFAPLPMRIFLNIVSFISIAVCAGALAQMAWIALDETKLFQSTAQTPWATPLWIPQTLWLGALGIFCAVAFWQAAALLLLAARREWRALDRDFGPRGAPDELEDELADLRQRTQTTQPSSGSAP
jgi:TRAP-type C4-dicarboxylate transport system permease small subunit